MLRRIVRRGRRAGARRAAPQPHRPSLSHAPSPPAHPPPPPLLHTHTSPRRPPHRTAPRPVRSACRGTHTGPARCGGGWGAMGHAMGRVGLAVRGRYESRYRARFALLCAFSAVTLPCVCTDRAAVWLPWFRCCAGHVTVCVCGGHVTAATLGCDNPTPRGNPTPYAVATLPCA